MSQITITRQELLELWHGLSTLANLKGFKLGYAVARSKAKLKIEVESKLAAKIGGPMDVTLKVNGKEVAQGQVPAAMSLHFTSNATFDIGTDLDSPVSLDYFDQAPFAFNGTIGTTTIKYLKK